MCRAAPMKSISRRRRAIILHHQIRSFRRDAELWVRAKWTAARCRDAWRPGTRARCGTGAPRMDCICGEWIIRQVVLTGLAVTREHPSEASAREGETQVQIQIGF